MRFARDVADRDTGDAGARAFTGSLAATNSGPVAWPRACAEPDAGPHAESDAVADTESHADTNSIAHADADADADADANTNSRARADADVRQSVFGHARKHGCCRAVRYRVRGRRDNR